MATRNEISPDLTESQDSLALAMTASANSPLLLLDGDLSVIAASDSFCSTFELEPTLVIGRRFSGLGEGEWDIPQVGALLSATASGLASVDEYEVDLHRKTQGTRHLVINARKLEYGDTENTRLMLSISDVTAARLQSKLSDDLLRDKAVMLQELQHRVANSLQIIASVLMQSARRVQSEETRGHLRDAHNRVMSIAKLQRQLAVSTTSDVVLRTYLRDLCSSIEASMIHDHEQLTLDVATDDSTIGAAASVSIGLIVTELVINAIKHAFPHRRHGKMLVDYHSEGAEWTLTVRDDGVGMAEENSTAGLGTSIIQALANQLDAVVEVAAGNPGTLVSVVHGKSPVHLLDA